MKYTFGWLETEIEFGVRRDFQIRIAHEPVTRPLVQRQTRSFEILLYVCPLSLFKVVATVVLEILPDLLLPPGPLRGLQPYERHSTIKCTTRILTWWLRFVK